MYIGKSIENKKCIQRTKSLFVICKVPSSKQATLKESMPIQRNHMNQQLTRKYIVDFSSRELLVPTTSETITMISSLKLIRTHQTQVFAPCSKIVVVVVVVYFQTYLQHIYFHHHFIKKFITQFEKEVGGSTPFIHYCN